MAVETRSQRPTTSKSKAYILLLHSCETIAAGIVCRSDFISNPPHPAADPKHTQAQLFFLTTRLKKRHPKLSYRLPPVHHSAGSADNATGSPHPWHSSSAKADRKHTPVFRSRLPSK